MSNPGDHNYAPSLTRRPGSCDVCAEPREAHKRIGERPPRPRVVCLCGSTRFIEVIAALAWHFEKLGCITFAPLYLPREVAQSDHQAEFEGVKEQIDELFKRKIDLSDEVFVVDFGGYVGESTRNELQYAVLLGLPVRYYSQDPKLQAVISGQFGDDGVKR